MSSCQVSWAIYTAGFRQQVTAIVAAMNEIGFAEKSVLVGDDDES
jgi:hypothetical protein